MRPLHGSVVPVESAHDALPSTAGFLELFAFTWQLLPDIFASKNVLGVQTSKMYRQHSGRILQPDTGRYVSDVHEGI